VSDNVVENESVASSGDDATEAFDNRSESERQRDEYLDALQRLQADFENYRKRVSRSSDDAAIRASGEIVAKMLPVLDAFDLAQAHFALTPSPESEALSQARGLMLDVLQREGLERVDSIDVPFDPQVHDAVAHVEGDESSTEPLVDEVLRAGYRWKGAVLRPAMVKVRG
jgi:molecular chaperone GrpE